MMSTNCLDLTATIGLVNRESLASASFRSRYREQLVGRNDCNSEPVLVFGASPSRRLPPLLPPSGSIPVPAAQQHNGTFPRGQPAAVPLYGRQNLFLNQESSGSDAQVSLEPVRTSEWGKIRRGRGFFNRCPIFGKQYSRASKHPRLSAQCPRVCAALDSVVGWDWGPVERDTPHPPAWLTTMGVCIGVLSAAQTVKHRTRVLYKYLARREMEYGKWNKWTMCWAV